MHTAITTSQIPLISYEAIQKASRIIKYVYKFYFPIHGLEAEDIFIYFPTLTSVESIIYQADLIMEMGQNENLSYIPQETDTSGLKMLKDSLLSFLKQLDLYDSEIEQELAKGEEFIKLENEIIIRGFNKHSDIMRVAELRSSDVRLLHLILFRMLKKNYDEQLLSLLWPVEVIADIEDDFNSYINDVNEGAYNTYRMFVKLYKENAPEYIKRELNYYETLFHKRLATFPIAKRENFMVLYTQFREIFFVQIPQPILE
jgi:hypothetical protein